MSPFSLCLAISCTVLLVWPTSVEGQAGFPQAFANKFNPKDNEPDDPKAWQPVEVTNESGFTAKGRVYYKVRSGPDFLCGDDEFELANGEKFTSPRRGSCRVSKLTAKIAAPGGEYENQMEYPGTGTGHSYFKIYPSFIGEI